MGTDRKGGALMAWTAPQQAAIDQRESNILVSAAAGSGKTAVLTQRVVERIVGEKEDRPIEIDRFLIVTFTSAAAQEMKERITQKLSDYIQALREREEEDNLEKIYYLERQIAMVPQASISTIHAFCLKTIKAYFNHLEIDPNIKVANEAELDIMKNDILDEMMEVYLGEGEADFLELAGVYGNVQGLETLKTLILDISTFSKSTPFPEMWLKEQVRHLKTPYSSIEKMPWASAIKKQLLGQVKDLLSIYDKAIGLCDVVNGPGLYKETLLFEYEHLKRISEDLPLEEILSCINEISFAPLSRKKQECDESLKERVKAYRDLCKEVIKNLQVDTSFYKDPKLIKQLPIVGRRMETLVKLIMDFEARYQMAKQDAGIVDYNDLEHFCLRLLIRPEFDEQGEMISCTYSEVAKELSAFYEEVYIDEYQDSNTVQETILKAIAEADKEMGPTRFMVGDMKQSIYRFRLANPLIFADKYDRWEKHKVGTVSNAKEVCIDLSQNFRSRSNILEGVNDIFEQVMSPQVGELIYDEYAKLKVGNLYLEGLDDTLPNEALADAIELHVLETKAKEDDEENGLEELKNVECEALMVADLIDQLLKGQGNPTHIFDKEIGAYRKVEARDMVILLRAPKEKANIYEAALMNKGIGAYAQMNHNFFDALEIQTMIAMLKLIDNPMQDIPLATVLRSPIVGVSLDELVYIRKAKQEGSFYEALQVYMESQEPNNEVIRFVAMLNAYREQSSELSLQELIANLYVETGYYRYVSMLPSGAKKKANLELLKKYAQDYEASNNGKLFGFVQYLDKLSQTTQGLEEAKLVGENENLVRIMSIHKSKGLEFSIVFLCDTGKRFNHNDLMKQVLLHYDLGMTPDYIDTESYVKYPTIPKLAIKNQIMSENISEEMRVLYVALTRAKEKLFITGTLPNLADKAYQWSLFASRTEKQILSLGVRRAGSYLNWIGLSLYAHSQIPDLRTMTGEAPSVLYEGNSKWRLQVWHKETLGALQENRQEHIQEKKQLLEAWDTQASYGVYHEEINRRLDFVYPHEAAVLLPTKVSVSEIKRDLGGIQVDSNDGFSLFTVEEAPVPRFIQQEEVLQGTRRGTLIHSVFEHWNFLTYSQEETIKEQLQLLVSEGKIEEEVLQVVDVKRLALFAQNVVIEKMRKAKYSGKEKTFTYLAKANLVDTSYLEEEEVLIQGIIDAFFIDEEGITLIDYKTDYVDLTQKVESLKLIYDRYHKQLQLYALALSNITKLPVAHMYIYLYNINEWMNIETSGGLVK